MKLIAVYLFTYWVNQNFKAGDTEFSLNKNLSRRVSSVEGVHFNLEEEFDSRSV